MKLFEKKIEYFNNKKIKKYHVLGLPLVKRTKKTPDKIAKYSSVIVQPDEENYQKKLTEYTQEKAQNRNQQAISELVCTEKNKLKSVKVCYISCTAQNERPLNDASTRYRCYHAAEALQKNVYLSLVVSLKGFLASLNYDYDIYIFHRPSCAVANFDIVLNQLKQLGKILIADYDDLIFGDEKIALQSSIFLNKIRGKEQIISIYCMNLKALRLFDNVSVSTMFLKTMVNKYHPKAQVSVVHNFLPESIFALAEKHQYIRAKKDLNLIMYCSGTLSHNQDFKLISNKILQLLKQDESLRFFIVGILDVDTKLSRHPRVFSHPPVNYWELFGLMQNAALTIAPLPLNQFNNCKSRVKFLESALSGATLLASPIPDMLKINSSGLCYMHEIKDWEKAIKNRHKIDLQQNIDNNFEYIRENCSSKSFLKEFGTLIENLKG